RPCLISGVVPPTVTRAFLFSDSGGEQGRAALCSPDPLSHGGGQILPRGSATPCSGASSLPELAGSQLRADLRLSSLLCPGGAPSRAAGPSAAPRPRPADLPARPAHGGGRRARSSPGRRMAV